jgi:hypothetical protein
VVYKQLDPANPFLQFSSTSDVAYIQSELEELALNNYKVELSAGAIKFYGKNGNDMTEFCRTHFMNQDQIAYIESEIQDFRMANPEIGMTFHNDQFILFKRETVSNDNFLLIRRDGVGDARSTKIEHR